MYAFSNSDSIFVLIMFLTIYFTFNLAFHLFIEFIKFIKNMCLLVFLFINSQKKEQFNKNNAP